MSCNTTRQTCTIDNIFAGNINTDCGGLFDPAVLQAEQIIYDSAYRDLINNYGITINYWVNSFNLSAADLLYGEHPTSVFRGPVAIKMYIELDQNALTLTNYGFNPGDEFTGYVHITTFYDTLSAIVDYQSFGQAIEPKSGDVIELSPLGCDRPGTRGAKWYEITERVDEDISNLNPMLGHYVWRLRGKRYDHSFEPGLSGETGNEQIHESSFSGKLSSSIVGVLTSSGKSYPTTQDPFDIDELSSDDVLDQSINNTDIYGDYGY